MDSDALDEPDFRVPSRFEPLLEGERRALELLKQRKQIDLAVNDVDSDNPKNAGQWSEARQLRGAFLTWLIVEAEVQRFLPAQRLTLRGVKVLSQLDLSFRSIEIALTFRQCSISTGMYINSTRFRSLEFYEVIVGGINAWAVFVDGMFRFERVTQTGLLNLSNARITGDLLVLHSNIDAGGIIAINAPNLDVKGNVSFEASQLSGRVSLINSNISGDLTMEGGEVDGKSRISINADGIKIFGRCFIRNGMAIRGTIRLLAARIGGELDLNSTQIDRVEEFALDARYARIGGTSYLSNGFRAEGKVAFYGAEIGGELNLNGAKINPSDQVALDFQNCEIKGGAKLGGGLSVFGAILFYGATIDGDVLCQGTSIFSTHRVAFDARRANINGAIFFTEGFVANKLVTLYGAEISGEISVRNAEINSPRLAFELNVAKATSLLIANSNIKGRIDLLSAEFARDLTIRDSIVDGDGGLALVANNMRARSFAILTVQTKVVGGIRLYGATFNGDVNIRDCSLAPDRESNVVFNAASMQCTGTLYWHPAMRPRGVANLEQARIGGLDDDVEKWPTRVLLDGFIYDRLVGDAAQTVSKRLDWIGRQAMYYSQPFEHLIAMYRKLGDSESAAEVAISKWRRHRRNMPNKGQRAWDLFLDWSSGYGYRPLRPLIALVVLVTLGAIVFAWGEEKGVFCAADSLKVSAQNTKLCEPSSAYPHFVPVEYSIETLLPIGDFGQKRLYVVRADNPFSIYVNCYSVAHRLFGWIFSALLALAPTNILKRE